MFEHKSAGHQCAQSAVVPVISIGRRRRSAAPRPLMGSAGTSVDARHRLLRARPAAQRRSNQLEHGPPISAPSVAAAGRYDSAPDTQRLTSSGGEASPSTPRRRPPSPRHLVLAFHSRSGRAIAFIWPAFK